MFQVVTEKFLFVTDLWNGAGKFGNNRKKMTWNVKRTIKIFPMAGNIKMISN
jgi:hypothetical protein